MHKAHGFDHADMPLMQVGDLVMSPNTDIPFGKPFRMGLAEYTIFDKATEEGYQAGLQAHVHCIEDHGNCDPIALDEKQLGLVLDAFVPKGLTEHNDGVWRAAFIAGWFAVFLGVASLE